MVFEEATVFTMHAASNTKDLTIALVKPMPVKSNGNPGPGWDDEDDPTMTSIQLIFQHPECSTGRSNRC
jgi:hypothetical protein